MTDTENLSTALDLADGYPEDVEVLELDGRRIVLVGTAHVSRESVDLVHHVIVQERPDTVCVELDAQRFEALSQRKRWEQTDLREVIRNRQLATLLINFFLASYQKRLGGKLGVMPGAELLEATKVAESLGVPVELSDRPIRITLRRAWAALSLPKKAMLLSSVLAGAFDAPELTEEELRKLRQKDVLSELMHELGQAMPALKRVLIDERDAYLATRILGAPGQRIVAVVGAGHVAGMRTALETGQLADLEELDRIPPMSPLWKAIGWGVSALILGSIAYIGLQKGPAAAGHNALYWFLANGIPSAVGCTIALGHPLTVVSAFLAAPFTSLTPLIGAGYVTAFVQTYLVPPRVAEFQSVGDDIAVARAWWRSRLLRIFLVFLLTSIGSLIGTWVGGVEIVSNVLGP
jgi:pheromone shutdown-related protein TraB